MSASPQARVALHGDMSTVPEIRTETSALSIRFAAAFQLAAEVHACQVRKGTSIPYVAHLMSVSALVLEAGGDEDCAIAALLHDAVEDSNNGAVMLDRIRGQFGGRVADIVEACSDTSAVPGRDKPEWKQRKMAYINHMRDADADALLVSACDKLHNARAIVADLREIGSNLWQRFSAEGYEQIWYYQTLSDIFSTRIRLTVAEALRDAVVEMTKLARSLGDATEEQFAWISYSTAEPAWELRNHSTQPATRPANVDPGVIPDR